MPRFKHKSTGNVVEVPEEHAEQNLRKSRYYIELGDTVEESSQTKSTVEEVEKTDTTPKRNVGRPKKRTEQERTNTVSKG